MDQSPSNVTPDQNSGYSNSKINSFYIEFDENWTNLGKRISEVNKEKKPSGVIKKKDGGASWSIPI